VSLGAVFENKQRFSRVNYEQIETTTSDTISIINSGFEMPMMYGAGLSYTYDNRLVIGADYTCHDWANANYFGSRSDLNNRHRVALGVEYRNDPSSRKYINQLYWRLGVNYTTAYTNKYNQNELGIGLGVGFPLRTAATIINATVEYGNRGAGDMLKENYLRLVVNASISEHWFFKRKL
jgi:opacity protein-like surface antigen